jgi:hypothetical protein
MHESTGLCEEEKVIKYVANKVSQAKYLPRSRRAVRGEGGTTALMIVSIRPNTGGLAEISDWDTKHGDYPPQLGDRTGMPESFEKSER